MTRSNMIGSTYTKVWNKCWDEFRLTNLKEGKKIVTETWVWDETLAKKKKDRNRPMKTVKARAMKAMKTMKAMKAMKAIKAMKKAAAPRRAKKKDD